jgi:ATP/maltotriose-dependent transcriptional regulator MalT/DNA-binding SARP family transcriptional activator
MPTLAKLTRPKVHRALQRERLFEHLDQARDRPLVWVVAPPGAGKTTLVSSYVEARKLKAAWYHVDAGDEDIGTFFYYLAQTLPASRSKREEPLPLFSPAYLADLPAFCRHFFRSFFARLPANGVLALDNYHELSPRSPMHSVLAQAVREVPEGQAIVVISRAGAPTELSHLRATEKVSTVDWTLLRLSLDETRAIAATRASIEDATLRRIHRLSDGWAAGIALSLERAKQASPSRSVQDSHEELAEMFDYFAAQVLSSATPEMQEFLKRTSLMPAMTTDMAKRMSGRADSEALLEDLHRRGMFTDRRNTKPPIYQYHDLFRAFLMTQLESSVTPTQLRDLQRQAGELLEQNDYRDHALRLHLAAHDWPAAQRIIIAAAPSLLAQGRWATLREWIKALPAEVAQHDPWLDYWLGTALARTSPAEARVPLERAFHALRARGDIAGQRTVCSTLIFTFRFEYANFIAVDRWIDELLPLLASDTPYPSPTAELQTQIACIFALSFRRPLQDVLETSAARAMTLLTEDLPPAFVVEVSGSLLVYLYLIGNMKTADRVATRLAALMDLPEIQPFGRALLCVELGHYLMRRGDLTNARMRFEQVLEIAQANAISLPVLHVYTQLGLAFCAFQRADIAAAEACRKLIEVHWAPERKMDQVATTRIQLWVACHRKQWEAAYDFAERQLTIVRETAMFALTFHAHVLVALTCATTKRQARLKEALEEIRALLKDTAFDHFEYHIDLIEAYAALLNGDRAACHEHLRRGLADSRIDEDKFILRMHPGFAPALFAEALASDIDTDYVARTIHELGTQAPSPAAIGWPWPLRVFTLGRFEILRDGRPLEFSRKAPKKTLALLKAIIALGGKNVREQALLDAFWSDEEGDVAARSLTATVHRLRTLLGDSEAIVQQGGTLSLDTARVWVDVWALDEIMTRQAGDRGEQVLSLYRGGFLPEDEGEPWSVTLRERLRSRFIHSLAGYARQREEAGEYEAAVEAYLRGLEADPAIELFYQGLMRSYAHLDRRSEAVAAYRRLKQILSISLSLKPSSATEKLYQSLRLNELANK